MSVTAAAEWLTTELAPCSLFGRRARETERPFRSGDLAAARKMSETVASAAERLSADELERARNLLRQLPDPGTALAQLQLGEVLDSAAFFAIERCVAVVAELRALLQGRVPSEFIPSPCERTALLLAPGVNPSGTFYLDECFDPRLTRERATFRDAEQIYQRERERLRALVALELGLAEARDGEFFVMRAEYRGSLPASVHVVRETPVYWLCELALDPAALAAQATYDDAAARVAAAEADVAAHLTRELRTGSSELNAAVERLGQLDLLLARIAFTQRHQAVVPELVAEPVLIVEDARYIPVAQALERVGARYTPISLKLEGAAVVTGPNMGGKSVALTTAAFCALCVASGVPVPARSARIGLFDRIIWLGGAGSDASLLSSFALEVVAARDALGIPGRVLVLLDEFARTTSPAEGRALLIGLLRAFAARDACALAATHFTGVAEAAGVAAFSIAGLREVPRVAPDAPLEELLARLTEAMDYRIVAGRAGPVQSDALALAELLGLPAELLATARELVSSSS